MTHGMIYVLVTFNVDGNKALNIGDHMTASKILVDNIQREIIEHSLRRPPYGHLEVYYILLQNWEIKYRNIPRTDPPTLDDVCTAVDCLDRRLKRNELWIENNLERDVLIESIANSSWYDCCCDSYDDGPYGEFLLDRVLDDLDDVDRKINLLLYTYNVECGSESDLFSSLTRCITDL